MGERPEEDLVSLDRDVSRGWRSLADWRANIALDVDAHADEDPLAPVRHAAGRSTWTRLGELTPSADEIPLRDALRRWVLALTVARIGRPDEVECARAESQESGLYGGDRPRRVSWRAAWRGAVAAKSSGETGLWLDAASEGGPLVAAASRAGAERRLEVVRRFGLDHPWTPLAPVDRSALRKAAAGLLEATDDLSRTVWRHALGGAATMSSVLHAAVARDAGEGWPANLNARWFHDTFGSRTEGLDLALGELPTRVGAASFARALYAFGFAVRVSVVPRSMPFALAHDPAGSAAHRLAFVFASLAADPEWQSRVLGLGARPALAQSRVLARSALLEARLHAARLLLGDDGAFAPADLFDEVGARLFENGVPARLRGAWPVARHDEVGRFVALAGAHAMAQTLRDSFDSDWYRNPHAWTHLRSLGASPAYQAIDAATLQALVGELARAFERALG
jgi:hypothetical protein